MRYLSPEIVEKFIAYLDSEIDLCLKDRSESMMAGKNELAMNAKIRVNQTEIIKSEFLQLITADEK
jgi:hypothetical protein